MVIANEEECFFFGFASTVHLFHDRRTEKVAFVSVVVKIVDRMTIPCL